MTAANAKDLQDALVLLITDDPDEVEYPGSWVWRELAELDESLVPDFGTVTTVTQRGGEGQGDEYYVIWKLVDENGDEWFYKADAYYSSYEGVDWDGAELARVTPVEKTVIVYEVAR